MAGDWIKFEIATLEKPEVLQIARILEVHKHFAIGALIKFWSWLDSNCVDGQVDGVTSTDVDGIVGCQGFTTALESVNWIEIDLKRIRLTVPNFEFHNGKTAKTRSSKTRSQANWRKNRVDDPASTSASTREDKSREERKKEDANASSKESDAKRRGTRLPDGWSPTDADIEKAKAKGFSDQQIETLTEEFSNYWKAKAGKDAIKLDWSATWRNWCINDIKHNGPPAERTHSGSPRGNSLSGGGAPTSSLVAAHRQITDEFALEGQDDDEPRIRY